MTWQQDETYEDMREIYLKNFPINEGSIKVNIKIPNFWFNN